MLAPSLLLLESTSRHFSLPRRTTLYVPGIAAARAVGGASESPKRSSVRPISAEQAALATMIASKYVAGTFMGSPRCSGLRGAAAVRRAPRRAHIAVRPDAD